MTHFQAKIFILPKVACIGKAFVGNFMHRGCSCCFVAKKTPIWTTILYVDIQKMPKGNFSMHNGVLICIWGWTIRGHEN